MVETILRTGYSVQVEVDTKSVFASPAEDFDDVPVTQSQRPLFPMEYSDLLLPACLS